jgi:hypothetical protein
MILFLVSPSLIFKSDFNYYASSVLKYLIVVSIIYVILKKKNVVFKRIDISKNLLNWLFFSGLVFVFFLSTIKIGSGLLPFQNVYTAFAWFFIVVGMSESIIMIGVRKLLREESKPLPIYSIIFMASLHITSYMLFLGNYSFSSQLFYMLLKSILAFAIFFKLFELLDNDIFKLAIIHAFYDLMIIGW